MLTVLRARVTALTRAETNVVHLQAIAEGEDAPRAVVAYPALTGPVAIGDTVHLNTTATSLRLGTGGVDFVVWNEANGASPDATFGDPDGTEHIVKLRYTPLQHAVRTVETDPAYTDVWTNAGTLMQTPVVVCGLHSQIAPVAAAVKAARPNACVAYIMTDGAALPLPFSSLVRDLQAAHLLDATLTAGQAFGGDYECVTVASALIAARYIARADVIVLGQGPGNAGTGTRYGFSGIEQGTLMDLAGRLWGVPIGVLRLSLADKRDRHHGLSHHSVTALGLIAQAPGLVAFPAGPEGDPPPGVPARAYHELREAVMNSPVAALHAVEEADGAPGLALLAERGVRVTSMGRAPEQDPLFFHAAAAAGALAAERVR
jgi:hypothetical protein